MTGTESSAFALVALGILAVACGPRHAERDAGTRRTPPVELPESCRGDRALPIRANARPIPRPTFSSASPTIRLDELAPALAGRARASRRSPVEVPRDTLERANRSESVDEVTIETPSLGDASALATHATIRTFAPGATRIEVRALSPSHRSFEDQYRRLLVAHDGSETATLDLDVTRIVRGNWRTSPDDSGAPIDRLAVRVVTPRPTDARVESIVFTDDDTLGSDGYSVARAERDGVVRPSVRLRPGTSASYLVDVPAGGMLDAWVASTTGHVALRLSVVDEGTRRLRAEVAAGTSWSRVHASLAPFAGRRVTLRFEAIGRETLLIGAPRIVSAASERRPPDVLVYLVDMLLATQLSAYGNPRAVSPTIDRLHAEGLSFARATSPAPWTKPSVPSLFTALAPTTHGVGAHDYLETLPETVPTIVDRFREAGFRTGSFSASPLGSTLSGLDRGFDVAVTPAHWDGRLGPMGQPTATEVQSELLAFVDAEPGRPFFAYLHTLDVHEYKAPMFRDGDPGDRPYDRAIRQQDQAIASLLEALRARGRDVIVVLTSDHGQALGDDRVSGEAGHGTSLHEAQTRIPLVFHAPAHLPSATSGDAVSLVDVAPTLLDLFGLPPLPDADGASLLGYATSARPRRVHAFVTSSREWFVWRPSDPPWLAVQDERGRKAIVVGDEDYRFHDLARDPCERVSVRGGFPDLRRALDAERRAIAARRTAFAERHATRAPAAYGPDVERLRALGYAQ